jgi:predicted transcriptional regulator
MKVVWEREPCTAPEVQERLMVATRWTYSTVRTLMDRLVGKGLLAAGKEGKVTWFRSLIRREDAQRSEVAYALRNAFDGALTPMMQCLMEAGDVTAGELAEIEAMIRARRSGRGEK